MMTLKVETYQDAVTGFDTAIAFKPDYVFTVMKFPFIWWFPWFPFFGKEYGVCTNLRDAEKLCLKKAVHFARILNKKTKVKILREVVINRKKTKDIIWENGWLIARDLFPWWRVAFNWVFFPEKPGKKDHKEKKAPPAKKEQPAKTK
jgi:hypothetical protein